MAQILSVYPRTEEGFPAGSVVKKKKKKSACQCKRLRKWGFDPGLGGSTGGGSGNPLQYSCWENSVNGRDWQATVHGVEKEMRLSEHTHIHTHRTEEIELT